MVAIQRHAVLAGRAAVYFAEGAAEVVRLVETALEADFADRKITVQQQLPGAVHPDAVQARQRTFRKFTPEEQMQMARTDAAGVRDLRH